MKALVACILALALFFRAAPICAAPVQAQAVAMMPDCEEAPNHHDEQPNHKGSDAAPACHACVFPPVVEARLTQPGPAVLVMGLPAIAQLQGAAREPPTPPPRAAAHADFQLFNGVTS